MLEDYIFFGKFVTLFDFRKKMSFKKVWSIYGEWGLVLKMVHEFSPDTSAYSQCFYYYCIHFIQDTVFLFNESNVRELISNFLQSVPGSTADIYSTVWHVNPWCLLELKEQSHLIRFALNLYGWIDLVMIASFVKNLTWILKAITNAYQVSFTSEDRHCCH
jgi:hypothetical protein